MPTLNMAVLYSTGIALVLALLDGLRLRGRVRDLQDQLRAKRVPKSEYEALRKELCPLQERLGAVQRPDTTSRRLGALQERLGALQRPPPPDAHWRVTYPPESGLGAGVGAEIDSLMSNFSQDLTQTTDDLTARLTEGLIPLQNMDPIELSSTTFTRSAVGSQGSEPTKPTPPTSEPNTPEGSHDAAENKPNEPDPNAWSRLLDE